MRRIVRHDHQIALTPLPNDSNHHDGDGDVLCPHNALREWRAWADMGFVRADAEDAGAGWAFPAAGA